MKKLLPFLFMVLCSPLFGQEADPQLSLSTSQLIFNYEDKIIVELKVENGPWKKYFLTKGTSIISLADCGLGRGVLCDKHIRICTPDGSTNCRQQKLKGKCRYEVLWDIASERWIIEQVSR